MTKARIALLITVLVAIGLIAYFDLTSYLSLESLKAQQDNASRFVDNNTLTAVLLFSCLYILITALSIPGAAALTLLAGALFGIVYGTVMVSFASTIGATLAMLLARYLLRGAVEHRFAKHLDTINRGIEKDGAYYLFGLRLVPLFPFFIINLAMGLTRIPAGKFFLVSQVGMLPGTFVYVNAGTQLAQINSFSGILSPTLIGSFVLLAVFPVLARQVLRAVSNRRKLKAFSKPGSFDTNLIIIGAGAAGLVTAYIAAASKARVTLIEKHKMGGDCLNTGCVPSKALIRSSRLAHDLKQAGDFGLSAGSTTNVDFSAVMQRVQSVITEIEPHDSIERYTGLGVDCLQGNAKITSPWTVDVDGQSISAPNIVIASGGEPAVPPITGLSDIDYLTSENLWQLQSLPKHLLILGGGVIGCELAQAFRRLGSRVSIVEMAPRLLALEDPDVSNALEDSLRSDGVEILTGYKGNEFTGNTLRCEAGDGSSKELSFDKVLIATGRKARTADLGLEDLGIETNPDGTISTNEYLQTSIPTIYACGDVAGPFQLTHVAAHQAWYCAVNALFGNLRRFKADYSVIPRGVFTDPEIARVGINEQEARQQNLAYEVVNYGIDDLDRAIADGNATGFVKVLTEPGNDRILGVTIVGAHAADLLAEYTLAMRHGLGLKKILGTVHSYPTYSEANKFAAGLWQQSHLPEKLLHIAERFNAWRRN